MEESTPQERLLEFIKSKKLSVRKFEKLSNLGNSFVSGVGDSLRQDSIEKIKSAFPDFDETWIVAGATKWDKDYKSLYEDLQRAVNTYFNSHDALQKLVRPGEESDQASLGNPSEPKKSTGKVYKKPGNEQGGI